MNKWKYIVCCLLISPLLLQAQKVDYQKKIMAMKECYKNFSGPNVHSEIHKIDGSDIVTFEQTDFLKSKFTQVDPELKQVKVTLLDQKDLSSWETKNAKQISDYYFNGGSGFHIAAHGLETPIGSSVEKILIGGKELGPESAAEMILQSLKSYDIILKTTKEPFPIVLHTCKSGQGGNNSFAAKLSKILAQKIPQVAVIASPELVWCEVDNKGNYNEYVSNQSGGKHGNWLVFQNGKQTMQGTSDYKSTVQKYLGK